MKTVKIVPGTRMTTLLKKLEAGDRSVLEAISEEAASTLKASGFSGEVAVLIGDVIPDEVPSRVVDLAA